MLKKVLVITFILLFAFQGVALAETAGSVILEDTIYGAFIGAVLGGAWYLLDQDEAGKKVATGTGIGAFGGFVLGLTEAFSVVEIDKNGDIKYAMPVIMVTERHGADFYSTSLLKINF
jgi:hypothetical protein